MSDFRYSNANDSEILAEIGSRLRSLRKARKLTQTEAADRAGLGRHTLYRAEQGDNPTLTTILRLLRVYGRLDAVEGFIPLIEISPMERLKERRASEVTRAPGEIRMGENDTGRADD
jgi:transcriptional regulator with XRE-family HTH domain